MRTSSIVVRSALIAAIGGLLFGFDTAVISGTLDSLRKEFLLNEWWLGFTIASALIGTILGAGTAQFPSNFFGRKPTLIIMAAFYFISAVCSACPWNTGTLTVNDWYLFVAARFLGGIAVGASSVVSPLYTAEISPAKRRGLLVAFTQFNIVFGILVAFFSNYLIILVHNEKMQGSAYSEFLSGIIASGMEWRWMFGVEAIPAAAFFLLLFIVPESPRWLIGKGRTDKARPILEKLGTDEDRNIDDEIKVIQDSIAEENRNGKERFFTKNLRFPIMLAICMAAFNQLSGINAILYYAPKIFRIAGASEQDVYFFPVIIGLTNLVFTMAALFVIDWFGRKKLMIAGSIGYVLSLSVVALAFIIYSPEFNLSISKINEKETQKTISKCKEALEAATDEDEKEFRKNELKAAQGDLEKDQLAIAQATEEFIAARGEAALPVDKDKDGSASKSVIPQAGIMIVLIGLMCFIAAHAFGQGACIWVFIGEIFPNTVRAQGQALGSFVHWVLAATITQLFLPLLALLGPANIFLIFAGLMVLQFIWVIFVMPETKQIPLEEMQKKLKR